MTEVKMKIESGGVAVDAREDMHCICKFEQYYAALCHEDGFEEYDTPVVMDAECEIVARCDDARMARWVAHLLNTGPACPVHRP